MAYNNVNLNDDYMKPMQNQLKTALQDVDAFDKMSDSDKKYIYDQMVIIGMTLTINQYQNQQNPNAKVTAQLRNAGKQVLEGLLGVSWYSYFTTRSMEHMCYLHQEDSWYPEHSSILPMGNLQLGNASSYIPLSIRGSHNQEDDTRRAEDCRRRRTSKAINLGVKLT